MPKCNICVEEKPAREFDIPTKAGVSNSCKECRVRKQKRVAKRRERKLAEIKAKVAFDLARVKRVQLDAQIKQLHDEFKRFTLPNRNRLNELEKKLALSGKVDPRSTTAIDNRIKHQQQAQDILDYQIRVVRTGLKIHSIYDLWRDRHGNDPREESEAEDN